MNSIYRIIITYLKNKTKKSYVINDILGIPFPIVLIINHLGSHYKGKSAPLWPEIYYIRSDENYHRE